MILGSPALVSSTLGGFRSRWMTPRWWAWCNAPASASSAGAMSGEGHRLLIADLTAALRERRAPMIPGAEARNAVALVMAIYESARTGHAVRVG